MKGEGHPAVQFLELAKHHNCGGFRCTNREITKWVRKEAHRDHARGSIRVTCAIPDGSVRPIGIFALATVAESVDLLEGTSYHPFRSNGHFSALQLVWLATDKAHTRKGLGSLMVGHVINLFAEIGAQVGIPHLILIPASEDKERLLRFYSDLGFTPYDKNGAMFLSLQLAQDAVAKAKASVDTGL